MSQMYYPVFPGPCAGDTGAPVEVSTVFESNDRHLRSLAKTLLQKVVASSAATPIVLGVRSIPGGGSLEVARHLALAASVSRNLRLISLKATVPDPASGRRERRVFLGHYSDLQSVGELVPGGIYVVFQETRGVPLILDPELGVQLSITPISARPLDAEKAALTLGKWLLPPGVGFSRDAMELVRDYCWPGDLAHMRITLGLAAQRAFVENLPVVDADLIQCVLSRKERNLTELCRMDQSGWGVPLGARDLLQLASFAGFNRVRKALEQLLIEGAVASGGGNATSAAKFLRLPYTTMISRQKVLSLGMT